MYRLIVEPDRYMYYNLHTDFKKTRFHVNAKTTNIHCRNYHNTNENILYAIIIYIFLLKPQKN